MTDISTSKRKHLRIPYNGKVDLRFNGKLFPGCRAQNLSLVGIWVMGCQDQEEGGQCDIEFHDAAPTANRPLRLKGEVIRVEDGGVALLFIDINLRTHGDLESLIKEKGGDASFTADAFFDDQVSH